MVLDAAGLGVETIDRHVPVSSLLRRGGSCVSLTSPVLANTDRLVTVTLITVPHLVSTVRLGMVPGAVTSLATLLAHNTGPGCGLAKRWAFFRPDHRALEVLGHLVDTGLLRPAVSHVFNFDQLPEAYDEKADSGKIVIDIQS